MGFVKSAELESKNERHLPVTLTNNEQRKNGYLFIHCLFKHYVCSAQNNVRYQGFVSQMFEYITPEKIEFNHKNFANLCCTVL